MLQSLTQSAQFYLNPITFLTKCQAQHGDYYRSRLGGKTIHFIFDPSLARSILGDPLTFVKTKFVYDKIMPITGRTGLVQIEGEEGLRLRQAFNAFFQKGFLEQYLAGAKEVVDEYAPRFEGTHDVRTIATEMVLETALIMFAGARRTNEATALSQHFLKLNDLCAREFKNLLPFRNPVRKGQISRVQGALDQTIDTFLENTKGPCLVQSIREAAAEIPMEVTTDFLRNQVKTFLFAGHETTATYLIMALHELARDAALQKEVREDLAGDSSGPITPAFLREILRLYSPAWMIVRESTSAGTLEGHSYEAGDFFFIGVHQIHRHPNFWPDPTKLNLENHENKSVAFMPYGFGKRHCIGSRLADLELQMILRHLLPRYHLEHCNPTESTKTKVMITAYPANPVQIRFAKR